MVCVFWEGCRTVVGEPDVAVGVDVEVVGAVEVVAVVVVEQGAGLARGGVEGVDSRAVAAAAEVVAAEGGEVDEAVAVAGPRGAVDGRVRCLLAQHGRIGVQVDGQLREEAVL